MKQEDLAWFAGFIDGEGTISINQHDKKRGPFLQPRMTVSNTHIPTLRHFEKLLEELNLAFYVDWKTNPSNFGERKPLWRISFVGFKRLFQVLKLIVPYLVTKKGQGELTFQFLQSRLNGATDNGGYKSYTGEEIKLAQQVRELNKKSHH